MVTPLARVPVELLDSVWLALVPLEAVGMFVAGPSAGLGIEQEALLVLLADMLVQVLRQRELAIELREVGSAVVSSHKRLTCPYLLVRYAVVFQEDEAIIPD